jgi:mevalonate pyrophosphate decarboxylase
VFPSSSSLSSHIAYFCPFVIRLYNNWDRSAGLSSSQAAYNSVNNTHAIISLALSDMPLQYVSGSRLIHIYLEEVKDRNKEKSLQFYRRYDTVMVD